jgi:nucleoside-diphosphate-sugar epimerase
MKQVCPEFVVHLASRTTPGRDLGDFEQQVAATVLPAITVARSLPASTRLAIFFGSCEEYGNTAPPFREDGPTMSFSPYGWAKNTTREAVLLVARTLGRPVCWVRPFLTFGPGQGSGLFVPDVIRACVRNQRLDLTTGEQTRDFIAVKDVCGMVQQILQHPDRADGKVVNLCSGQPRTIRSVGDAIRRLVGRGDLCWGALPYRTAEAMEFYGSTDTFDRVFGHYPLTDFDHALAETITTEESSPLPSPEAS